jgi:hypothetical protein
MRLALPAICLLTLVSAAFAGGSASAGPALDDDKSSDPAEETEPRLMSGVEYGVGLRARSVWIPKSILELFVERAAGGAQNFGFGLDLTRRRGNVELQLGFEYENVNVGQGVWIKKGEDVALGDEADFILSPESSGNQLSWFTVEFTFLNHAEISKLLAVRYGGGLGVGIVLGELNRHDIICAQGSTNSMPEPGCIPPGRFGGTGSFSGPEGQVNSYDLPPVFPVINAIVGVQIRPTDQLRINIEGGIRTLPFVGVSTAFFF